MRVSSGLAVSSHPRRRVAFAAMAALAPAFAIPSEARPRCQSGQIYRPSLGICQSKTSPGARPYVKRLYVNKAGPARKSVKEPDPALKAIARAGATSSRHTGSTNTAAANGAPRERIIVREIVREKEPEPLSAIPLPVPAQRGSLNPLPRWHSDLQFEMPAFGFAQPRP